MRVCLYQKNNGVYHMRLDSYERCDALEIHPTYTAGSRTEAQSDRSKFFRVAHASEEIQIKFYKQPQLMCWDRLYRGQGVGKPVIRGNE